MPLCDQSALVRQAMLARLTEPAEHDHDASGESAEKKGIGMAPYAALLGGSLADGVTTDRALASGRGAEGNPLMVGGGRGAVAAQKAATTALLAILMKKLSAGHPKLAAGLGYGMGGLMGGMAAHNETVGK